MPAPVCSGFDVKKAIVRQLHAVGFCQVFFEQSHDLWELMSSFISFSLLSIIREREQFHAAVTF